MSLSKFLTECDIALSSLDEQRGLPWHTAGAMGTPPSAYRLARDCLRKLVETASVLAPVDNLPPVDMTHVTALRDENVAAAIIRVKQLKNWAVSLSATEATRATAGAQNDDDAYRPAKDLIKTESWPKNFKELNAALDEHHEIRTRRPTSKEGTPISNRLLVHLLDWVKYLDKRGATPAADPLDQPAEVVDRAVQEVARRKAEIDRRREGAK
jgi:hypothetical protein